MSYPKQEFNQTRPMLWDLWHPCSNPLLSTRSYPAPLLLWYLQMTELACPSSDSLAWDNSPNYNPNKSIVHIIVPWIFLCFHGLFKTYLLLWALQLYHSNPSSSASSTLLSLMPPWSPLRWYSISYTTLCWWNSYKSLTRTQQHQSLILTLDFDINGL